MLTFNIPYIGLEDHQKNTRVIFISFGKFQNPLPHFFIDFNICISTLSIDIIPLFFRKYISNLRINSPQNYSFSSAGKIIQPLFLLSSILLSSLHSSGTLTVR